MFIRVDAKRTFILNGKYNLEHIVLLHFYGVTWNTASDDCLNGILLFTMRRNVDLESELSILELFESFNLVSPLMSDQRHIKITCNRSRKATVEAINTPASYKSDFRIKGAERRRKFKNVKNKNRIKCYYISSKCTSIYFH